MSCDLSDDEKAKLEIDGRGVVPNDFSEEMLYVLRYRNPNPEH